MVMMPKGVLREPLSLPPRTARPTLTLRWWSWLQYREIGWHDVARAPGFPWLRHLDRALYVTPRSRVWWTLAWWRYLAGPAFRAAMLLGLWHVHEGQLYTAGHWTLPWRASARPRFGSVRTALWWVCGRLP